MAFGIFDLRIEEGLTQFIVREKYAQRGARLRPALHYAVGVDVISGLLIFALTLMGILVLPIGLNHDTVVVAVASAIASLISVSDGSFCAVLYAEHAFGWLSMYQIIMNGSRCAVLLALPIHTAADAAWAFVVAQGVSTAFVGIVSVQFVPRGTQAARLDSVERRWLLRFSIHVAAASAIATVRSTAIPLVVGGIGTKRQVAFARVAESPTKLLGVAAAPLRTVLFPRLSAAWARRDLDDARKLVRNYIATTLVVGGFAGILMAGAMGPLLTKLFGSAYSDLERVGQVFVLAALLDAIAGWQKVAPAAFDKPWLRIFILCCETSALVVALLILVPTHGALGAAISAAVAAAASLAVGAYWLRPAFAESTWRARHGRDHASVEATAAHRSN